ncbi:hypothetical protein [Aquimarina longa]|uniref:hypothetical protein n=1 Tax=Aquimarina longa TaxID=1080221 RepID=UPI0007803052|nr:hypothetical protein [Aquimarina longa]
MRSNQEILDHLGMIITEGIVDNSYETIDKILFKGSPNPLKQKYFTAFNQLEEKNKNLVKQFILKNNHNIIFEFLKIFEEHEEFKLIYKENGKQVNLIEISEMLKAEPIIENGWIARFSKYVKDDEII